MAKKQPTTKPSAEPQAPAALEAPANPFAALAQAPATQAPAPVAKETAVGSVVYRTAKHVAVLKGNGGQAPAAFAKATYKLGAKPYSPKAGTFTVMQWAAFTGAIAQHGGQATGAEVWAYASTTLGLTAAQLQSLVGFAPYRAKPGNLVIA